jgi:DNA polymerase III alpha subunit
MDTFELRDGKVHSPLYLIESIGDSASMAIREAREQGGDFKSFQDFYERVNKTIVDLKVMHNLILCGAFDHISMVKGKDLIRLYHLFRRVEDLKMGRGKKGLELLAAVDQYNKEGRKLDVPELYADPVELEVKRVSLLPIYRLDVHEHFRENLKRWNLLYDDQGIVTAVVNKETIRVLRNTKDLQKLENSNVAWVGLMQSAEEFRYKDKRTGQQVTALKFYIINDGDTMECVLWPNLYTQWGAPKDNKLIFVKGILRESREPGKWSLHVNGFSQF